MLNRFTIVIAFCFSSSVLAVTYVEPNYRQEALKIWIEKNKDTAKKSKVKALGVSPPLTTATPMGYGAGSGVFFVGVSASSSQYTQEKPDGHLSFGGGFGNPDESFGGQFGVNIISLTSQE